MIALIFNRRLLALSVLFVLAIGAGAMLTTPRAEDPTIQSRNAAVTTLYPGASAQRVDALVTRVIDEALRTLAAMKLRMSRRCGAVYGTSWLTLKLICPPAHCLLI